MDQVLERAIATTRRLSESLGEEIARAQAERATLGSFDVEALLKRGQSRERFNLAVVKAQRELGAALEEAGQALGLAEVTLEALEQAAPLEGRRLAEALADVRARARELAAEDEINQTLCRRALACVRAYLSAVAPPAVAYDRRGSAKSAPGGTWSGRA